MYEVCTTLEIQHTRCAQRKTETSHAAAIIPASPGPASRRAEIPLVYRRRTGALAFAALFMPCPARGNKHSAFPAGNQARVAHPSMIHPSIHPSPSSARHSFLHQLFLSLAPSTKQAAHINIRGSTSWAPMSKASGLLHSVRSFSFELGTNHNFRRPGDSN